MAQFSAANSRLAVENDKLRTGGQESVRDPSDVLHEIQCLRGRLAMLEGAAAHLERSSPTKPHTGNLDSILADGFAQHSQAGYVPKIFKLCRFKLLNVVTKMSALQGFRHRDGPNSWLEEERPYSPRCWKFTGACEIKQCKQLSDQRYVGSCSLCHDCCCPCTASHAVQCVQVGHPAHTLPCIPQQEEHQARLVLGTEE